MIQKKISSHGMYYYIFYMKRNLNNLDYYVFIQYT